MNERSEILEEIVRRTVAAMHPLRIMLFGSAARGDAGSNSDLDLLVIMPDGVHRRQTAQHLHEVLFGVGYAKDIVVATVSDIARHRNNAGLIYAEALDTGVEVYHAA